MNISSQSLSLCRCLCLSPTVRLLIKLFFNSDFIFNPTVSSSSVFTPSSPLLSLLCLPPSHLLTKTLIYVMYFLSSLKLPLSSLFLLLLSFCLPSLSFFFLFFFLLGLTPSLSSPPPPPSLSYKTFLSEDAGPDTLVAIVHANDPDGDSVSYAITGGNEDSNFLLDNQKGERERRCVRTKHGGVLYKLTQSSHWITQHPDNQKTLKQSLHKK